MVLIPGWGVVVLRASVCAVLASGLAGCGSSDRDDDDGTQSAEVEKQLADHVAGKACESDKDCANGACHEEVPAFPNANREAQPAPGGFCSFACRINADCGDGSFCIGAGPNAFSFELPDDKGLCLSSCDVDHLCRDGYDCVDLFGLPIGSESGSGATQGSCQPHVEPEY